MKKKMEMTFAVPDYICDLFKASQVAETMAKQYAAVAVDTHEEAWREIERIHPQQDGYFYSFNSSTKQVTRLKRTDPPPRQK